MTDLIYYSERREVPPPKRESNPHREQQSSNTRTTSGRIGLDRSVSLRKDPEERKKIAKKVQRRRSNSVDSNNSGDFQRKNIFDRKRTEKNSSTTDQSRYTKTNSPDWAFPDQRPVKKTTTVQAVINTDTVDQRFVFDSQTSRRRKNSEKEEPKKTIFSNFTARGFLRKKKPKKDKNDNSKAAVVVNKKREVLPDKIVLHQATTYNIIQLKNFLMERLTKNQVSPQTIYILDGYDISLSK